jgi:hypothetical protein
VSQVNASRASLSRLMLACTASKSLVALDISNHGEFRRNAKLTASQVDECLRKTILGSNLMSLNL